MTKNEEETKYIQHEKTLYAICKGVMLLWATTLPTPLPPNISQSSLKTPHPDTPPNPHPTHIRSYTHRTSRNTITSLSLLVWKKVKHCETPQPLSSFPPSSSSSSSLSPPSSVREGRQGLGTVVPLIRLWVVHLQCVEELVSVEAAHGVDGVAQHGHPSVAAGRCHATQHPPLIAGGVVHLHAAQRVRAVKATNNKEFAWTKRETTLEKRDKVITFYTKNNYSNPRDTF